MPPLEAGLSSRFQNRESSDVDANAMHDPGIPRREICPACGTKARPFFELPSVPTNSCVLMESEEEALAYPRGDVVLGFCTGCGFVWNLAFDPRLTEYSGRYEETQGFSPTFREFHRKLAAELLERHGLRDKDILEIGCGKGEFLALLCELGQNRGIGFDPSYDEQREILDGIDNVRVVRDFYSDAYADLQADLVCCKMTLEHIPDTGEFARLARRAMRPNPESVLYFLVPNAKRILNECAFEDIYYEHCSYFTAGSLARLFRSTGLRIHRLGTEYAGQYLAIEAGPADQATELELAEECDLAELQSLVASFSRRCEAKIDSWRRRLRSARSNGSVVLWGSGSKGVAFLGAVDRDRLVDRVVDINPHKQGHYMPSSGQEIVAPASLRDDPPDTVIVMNAIYEQEIAAELAGMGIGAEVFSL
jgi:SAM-dependent methyltransferase